MLIRFITLLVNYPDEITSLDRQRLSVELSNNNRDEQLVDHAKIETQMRSRREKERSRTQNFILLHPSSRATFSPLQTSKDFH